MSEYEEDTEQLLKKLPEKQLKPSVEIDNMKIHFLVEEAIEKIQFLAKINEKEDNSSELAGFEINKLLKEQIRLENEYALLIKKRSRLKGIANRDEHKIAEEQIKQVSQKLKESTKKLCRLFKENTNLDDDSRKVREERNRLLITLGDFMEAFSQNKVDGYIQDITLQLESQNMLQDNLEIEKQLNKDLKNLKFQINEQKKDYEDLKKEMKTKIQSLKEDLSKAKSECELDLKYEKKIIDTKISTQARINNQNLQNTQKETERISKLREREVDVFEKIKSYLEEETDSLRGRIDKWNIKSDEKRAELVGKIEHFKKETIINRERIRKLSTSMAQEKKEIKEHKEKILSQIRRNEKKNQLEMKIDANMMLIQKAYEEWKAKKDSKKGRKGRKRNKR